MTRRAAVPLAFLLLALAAVLTGCATVNPVSEPRRPDPEPGRTYSGAVRPVYDPEVREKCAAWGFPEYLWCLEIEQARADGE